MPKPDKVLLQPLRLKLALEPQPDAIHEESVPERPLKMPENFKSPFLGSEFLGPDKVLSQPQKQKSSTEPLPAKMNA